MEAVYNNDTQNQSTSLDGGTLCQNSIYIFMTIDIVTIITGESVISKLLWFFYTSKKKIDILNFNLALFHKLQYFVAILHFFCLFIWPDKHLYFIKFLFMYAEIGGPMSLTCICLERYCAVLLPMSYPLLKKYRYRELCAASVWLTSLSLALLGTSVQKKYPELAETFLKTIPTSFVGCAMVIIVWCNGSIASKLRKSGPRREALHAAKKRALRTVRASSIIIVLCYSPVTLLQQVTFDDEDLYTCVTTPVCILFLCVASAVHPLFYLSTQGKLCPCLKRAKQIP